VLTTIVSPASTRAETTMTNDMMACASRIANELPHDALVLSDNDSLLYIRAGRQSMRLVVPSKHRYSDGSDGMLRESLHVSEVVRSHHLCYFLMHRSYDRDLGDKGMRTIPLSIRTPT
jgi:hypothetical protein